LSETGLLVAGPVGPVAPEPPDWDTGLLRALDPAEPVLPLFVALDWELAEPELPVAAEGSDDTVAAPPTPPLALPTATEEPPIAVTMPVGAVTTLTAVPPALAMGRVNPPPPPRPPTPTTNNPLPAPPDGPDADSDVAPAPELALLSARPIAVAGPVLPDRPEDPETALPPMTMTVPRMPVFVAVGLEIAAPVAPVDPELPEMATGLDTALDVALPVLPVLVALDWALVEPELPVVADGLTRTDDPPPLPPLALPTATLDPPMAVEAKVGAVMTFVAAPPGPATGMATPP
jgi:hypothetical protein